MVELIYEYKFDPKLFNLLACPTCKSKLKKIQLIDMFAQGLICENNHRFFIELKAPLSIETAKCSSIKGTTIKNSSEIIKIWLTNFQYRSKLNNQLAAIIRRIYEILNENIRILHNSDVFKYCPFCFDALRKFEQNDIWFQGLKCGNSHQFLARNGISFFFGNEQVTLQEEMPDTVLFDLIKTWLRNKNGELKSNLHDQIRLVMENFRQGMGDAVR